jgi:AAA15 family ATPase/GTPase
MLIEFTVGNFKSFRDKTTFSMIAANLTSEDPDLDTENVIPISKNLSLLKSAAVYGANASGKSNLGIALRFMRDLVHSSAREAIMPVETGLEPFLLDQESHTRPSFFEMVFLLAGRQYRYGFEVDKTQVVSEWLFHVPKTKEVSLFTRERQEISIRTGFKEGKGLESKTRKDALFLSVTALFNGTTTQQIQAWFDDFAIETGLQDDHFREFTIDCLRDPKQREVILNFIRKLDLGIEEVIVPEPLSAEILPKHWSDDTKDRFLADMPQEIYVRHFMAASVGAITDPNNYVLLDLDKQESQGTRKLVSMAGPLWSILRYGHVLFVDELDARLHPLMTRRIIELFHSPLTNPNGAQLIFATHDTNLLDKTLFRRDQIWFAEKDRQGATHLASLAEYKVRSDAAFEKQYLEGRYGAIPFLGDLNRLPWAQKQEEAQDRDSAQQETGHA